MRAKDSAFDLDERVACFGEAILGFTNEIPRNSVNDPLVMRLIRSSTKVVRNCCEANDNVSEEEFQDKIEICIKESEETKHWLRKIVSENKLHEPKAEELWKEAKELNLIFSRISRSDGS